MEQVPHELTQRVARLERQNRRLSIALSAVALLAAAVVIIAAKPADTPADVRFRRLEASEIVVSNGDGIELHIWSRSTVPNGVAIDLTKTDAKGKHVLGRFAAFEDAGQLIVSRSQDKQSIMLMPSGGELIQRGAGRGPGIIIRGDAPFLSLSDEKAYTTIVGAATLAGANGSELNTTAAGLHLFSNEGKVIWRAP